MTDTPSNLRYRSPEMQAEIDAAKRDAMPKKNSKYDCHDIEFVPTVLSPIAHRDIVNALKFARKCINLKEDNEMDALDKHAIYLIDDALTKAGAE